MIALYANSDKQNGIEFTARLSAYLNTQGLCNRIFNEESISELSELQAELVVAMGGDGTILNVVNHLNSEVPVLGVNFGNLGFLTALENADVELVGKAIKEKAYQTENRDMLKVEIEGNCFNALNEVVFTRKSAFQTITVSAFVDDTFIDVYSGDGVLVATPTGSTAYSLSCGGPILTPDLSALLLIGINPHSLHNRPIVLSNQRPITLTMKDGACGMSILCDGRNVFASDKATKVVITKSSKKACFAIISADGFFDKLHQKLIIWGGGVK